LKHATDKRTLARLRSTNDVFKSSYFKLPFELTRYPTPTDN